MGGRTWLSAGQREILAAGWWPVYAPSGYVIYQSIEPPGVWAIPFSVDTMKATGNPFPISENSSEPSIALDGTLVYLSGGLDSQWQLVWKDREGKQLGTIGQFQDYIKYPALSPNENQVAVAGWEDGNQDIYVHEVDRPVKTRLTFHERSDLLPTWSPTGDRIAFSSGRTGGRDLYVSRADGSGDPELLLSASEFRYYLTDWSPDESILSFFRQNNLRAEDDLMYLQRKEDGSGYQEIPFLQTKFKERTAKLSPDGRYVAYSSNQSGQYEVYIRSFPDARGQERVSENGGSQPRWRKDGKELFYVEDTTLIAVSVSTSPDLTVGSPERMFSSAGLRLSAAHVLTYDVTADGERFVIVEPVADEGEVPDPVIRVVQNWYEEFRDREQD